MYYVSMCSCIAEAMIEPIIHDKINGTEKYMNTMQ
jgi:hypothetical protein